MNVSELIEALEDFGGHIEVRVAVERRGNDEFRAIDEVEYLSGSVEMDHPAVVITILD